MYEPVSDATVRITDRCLPIAQADIFDLTTTPALPVRTAAPVPYPVTPTRRPRTSPRPSTGTAHDHNSPLKPSRAPRRGAPNRKSRAAAAQRIVIQYPTPAVDGGRYAAKRCVGDTVTVEADIFRDGHDLLRAVVRYKGPGDDDYREAEMERIDAHLGGVRWAGSFDVDRQGRWEYTVRGVDRRVRDLARRARAQGRRAAARPRRRALRGRPAAQGGEEGRHRRGRQGADRARRRPRSRTTRSPRRPSTTSRSAPSCSPPSSGSSPATAASPSRSRSPIEVDRLRARFGSWYELFPRSWGGLSGVEAPAPAAGRARLRHPLPAADPPDRPDQPQGRQQLADRRTERPRLPLGDRRRDRRPRRRPPRPRHDRGPQSPHASGKASTDIDIALDFAIQARPTTRGCTSIPSGSTAARTARSSTPRTRPSATRTSTTSTGSRRTGAACGTRC